MTNKENAVAKAVEIMAKAKAAISEAKVKTDADREARKLEIEKERETRKAARVAADKVRLAEKIKKDLAKATERAEKAKAHAEKKAAKAAVKAKAEPKLPSHTKKLDKFASKLPKLDKISEAAYNGYAELAGNVEHGDVSLSDLSTVVAHLSFLHRSLSTTKSKTCVIEDADRVKIVSSIDDVSLVGLMGTVIQVRKIHALVDVGRKNPAYVYLSDLVCIEHATVEVTKSTTSEENISTDGTDLQVAANG